VNIAYESVGGKVLDSTIDSLAVGGKCIQIGFISSYKDGDMSRGVSPRGKTMSIKTKYGQRTHFILI
jgi:NADPH-dependent curcumin reductase CurA